VLCLKNEAEEVKITHQFHIKFTESPGKTRASSPFLRAPFQAGQMSCAKSEFMSQKSKMGLFTGVRRGTGMQVVCKQSIGLGKRTTVSLCQSIIDASVHRLRHRHRHRHRRSTATATPAGSNAQRMSVSRARI